MNYNSFFKLLCYVNETIVFAIRLPIYTYRYTRVYYSSAIVGLYYDKASE